MIDWWNSMNVIEQFFAIVAIPSTLVLLIQTILMLFGIAHSGDVDMDMTVDTTGDGIPDSPDPMAEPDVDVGLRVFTVRGFIAFFTVFGWTGLAMLRGGMSTGLAIPLAMVFGALSMLVMALIIKAFLKLQQDGTTDISNAVGAAGTVYLTVPAVREDKGKVSVVVQEKLTEFDAVTDDDKPIKTGAEVVVVGVSGKNTLVVSRK